MVFPIVSMHTDLQFEKALEKGGISFLKNEKLSAHSTFRIGGEADFFLSPSGPEELGTCVRLCLQNGIRSWIVGNGSNTLFSDKGFRGAVIEMKHMSRLEIRGTELTAQAGVMMPVLCEKARRASLDGVNFAIGIPGTLGGAVAMNSGCYGQCMADIVKCVTVFDSEEGVFRSLERKDLSFGTRDSVFLHRPSWILCEATLELAKGCREDLYAQAEEFRQKRSSTQPLDKPSAGSVFKRAEGQEPVSKLVDLLGFKGVRIGDAAVSEKHAGFIVNEGKATQEDVLALVRKIQQAVSDAYGFIPEPEIRIVGE